MDNEWYGEAPKGGGGGRSPLTVRSRGFSFRNALTSRQVRAAGRFIV